MNIDTRPFVRCIQVLEMALSLLKKAEPGTIDYDIFRNSAVKGFELTVESACKLLRNGLKAVTGRLYDIDLLTNEEVLRDAASYGLVSTDEVERWFAYRDNRDDTAHDYGAGFDEDILQLLPQFIDDARKLQSALRKRFDDTEP